ncbi:DUF742 domain-containing protein [Actinokineospora guangxiensis]|uniref:DUF742 domain-containing protein n=1 Tax=Actinokineospora guangxiensis TaxID=1490288 RepID=A0ABW0EUB1_9PSEU
MGTDDSGSAGSGSAGSGSAGSGFADLLNGLTLGRQGSRRGREKQPAAPPPTVDRAPSAAVEPTEAADIVRAYAWTAGRTRSEARLELETLVSLAEGCSTARLPAEHHAVVELCRAARSVAEVAALLSLPLGVAKVLVGDLATRGVLVVRSSGAAPDIGIMERVLAGLRRL